MPNTIPVQRTVQNRDLTPNTKVMVRGNIEFSRLTKMVDGEALEQANQRRVALGMQPINKPYTSVTLTNARIVPMKAGVKSPEEIYVEERFYKRQGDPAGAPFHYAFDNKSKFGNTFYMEELKDGKTEWNQFQPDGELANGLDVTLLMEVFQPKGFAQKGLAMRGVILHEPARYYQPATDLDLAAAGIIINRDPSLRNDANTATTAPTTPAAPAADTIQVSAPAANPYASQQAAPAATPVAQPEPDGPWTCPNCGTLNPAGQMFCGGCGTKKSAPQPNVGNPYAQGGGIRYDGNERNY